MNESVQPPKNQPIINLRGERVALGPRQRDQVPLFLRWINDFTVTRTYGMRFRNRTLEAMEENYERGSKGGADYVDFTIYESATLQPIGWTGLEEIDHFDRTAKYTILIGEPTCWGKGYGTETTRLVLDYGFHGLGLHSIYLTVFSFNERGIRAYQRAGFREIGRRREAHRCGGLAYDVIYMDCLATEFTTSVFQQFLPS